MEYYTQKNNGGYFCSQKQVLADSYIKKHSVELPGWFSIVPPKNEQLKNAFNIKEVVTPLEYNYVKKCLKKLEFLYYTRVSYTVFCDFFKTVNFLIATPLSKAVFNLKMKPLYTIFKALPLILFNEQTCRALGILTPFFPSAHDIDKIMNIHIKQVTKNIGLLRQLIQ